MSKNGTSEGKTMKELFASQGPWTMHRLFESFALEERVYKIYTTPDDYFEVIQNPTRSQLIALAKGCDIDYSNFQFNLRGLISKSEDLYVWNAYHMTHEQMLRELYDSEGITDIFIAQCIVWKDHINIYTENELSNTEKLEFFDNTHLLNLYKTDLNIDFDTYKKLS